MPNQRKKGKKLATFWITPEEKKILVKLAKDAGLDISSFLKLPITDYLNKNKKTD
jgi:hypothetical protein